MRIDVAEYIAECRKTIKYCQARQTELETILTALQTFRKEMEVNFLGETGDSIVTYLDEVIQPLIIKTNQLLTVVITTNGTMENDMITHFDEDGIIDLDYINGEYSRNFSSYSDEISQNLYEVNQLTCSISDIIDLPRLHEERPQELKHDMRMQIEKATNLVVDTDRVWKAQLELVNEQIEEIKTLIARIEEYASSPIDYKSGTIQLLNISKSDEVKTLADFDTVQEYYEYVITRGINEGKVTVKTIDGQNYYEFNDDFWWSNYGAADMHGKLVFVDNGNGFEMFIFRTGASIRNNAISVPFGIFDPDPFNLLFRGETWNEEQGKEITLIHFRTESEHFPEHLKSRIDELKDIAKFYSKEKNSDDLGKAILRYIGNYEKNGEQIEFTLHELDDIATRWSGGNSWQDFGGEIEAHADMLLGTLFTENIAKPVAKNSRKITDTEYYNAAAIADLGAADKVEGIPSPMNKYFNLFWGGPREKNIENGNRNLDMPHYRYPRSKEAREKNISFKDLIKAETISQEQIELLVSAVNQLEWRGIK